MNKFYLFVFAGLLGYLPCFAQNTFPASGNVGIGTTSPTNKLTISGGENNKSIEISGGYYFRDANTHYFPALSFYSTVSGARKTSASSEIVFTDRQGTSGYPTEARASDILFYTAHSYDSPSNSYGTFPDLTMVLKSAQYGGLVGIGTINPNAKLDIQGSLLTGSGIGNLDPAVANLNFLAGTSQMLIGWNRTAGYGEADFIANQGVGGSGGFAFYNHDNNNVETQLMRIWGDGTVGIGTTTPNTAYKLSVNGSIRSKEVKVETGWADYVFKPNYHLKSLSDVEEYISQKGHLPEVPSEAEVKKNGVNVGETEALLLKKIEELTLYLIEKDKDIKKLQVQVQVLRNKIGS